MLQAFLATWAQARDTFGEGQPKTGEEFDNSARLQNLEWIVRTAARADEWWGAAATAFAETNTRHADTIGDLARLDQRLSSYVTESAQLVANGRQNLHEIRNSVLAAAQSVPVGPLREQTLMAVVQHGLALLSDLVWRSNSQLTTIGGRIQRLSEEYAALGVGASDREEPDENQDRTVRAVDFPQTPPGWPEDVANLRQHEADAFREVFGREPSSAVDWQTAAALDPHSYHPDADGLAPEIKVAKINPVPGQGVVRAGQWIEQRDVISGPWKRDFGNTRTADPHFVPADTKVTTYVDYENGLVVMRQNPSVELDANGGPGEVRVGIPEASVQQASDGAVRIQYEAANPFAPDIAQNPPWPMGDNPWTVNGDLVFTPTADGVRIDGTRTDYPSMELYQDFPDGSSRTVLIDPAIAGNSTGPMVNLPRHHEIGVGGSAFAPFDTGAWNPEYDVRVPLPSTELGPSSHPPSTSPVSLPPGVTQI